VSDATSQRTPHPLVGAAFVLCAACLWATFGIFAKYLYEAGYSPIELASVRAAVAFAGIAIFALLTRRSVRLPLRALPFFAAYGILGFAAFELIFFAALERTTVSVAVALLYTAPAFVLVLSALLWRERISPFRMLSLLIVLTGVMLVTGAAGGLLRGTASLPVAALLLGLGSGLGYAFYTLFSKVATERHGALASLFWSFAFATLALGLLADPVTPFLRDSSQTPLLIGLGIVPTILPYAFYLAALRLLRASTAAMLASIEPGVAALLAAVLLAERMDMLQTIGLALIVVAAVLLAREVSAAPASGAVAGDSGGRGA
jgi:drug/metabolite transporter, DME family